MNEFLARLKQRKLVQWAIAYVAAAFALLQGIDIVAQQFGWPDDVRRSITLALVIGFFVTLVLAWYHGEGCAQRVGDAAEKTLDKFEKPASGDARFTGTFYDLRSRMMARLGKKKEAISSLEQALSKPCDGITGMAPTPELLRLDPDYDSLRGDPRFEKLCQPSAK